MVRPSERNPPPGGLWRAELIKTYKDGRVPAVLLLGGLLWNSRTSIWIPAKAGERVDLPFIGWAAWVGVSIEPDTYKLPVFVPVEKVRDGVWKRRDVDVTPKAGGQ